MTSRYVPSRRSRRDVDRAADHFRACLAGAPGDEAVDGLDLLATETGRSTTCVIQTVYAVMSRVLSDAVNSLQVRPDDYRRIRSTRGDHTADLYRRHDGGEHLLQFQQPESTPVVIPIGRGRQSEWTRMAPVPLAKPPTLSACPATPYDVGSRADFPASGGLDGFRRLPRRSGAWFRWSSRRRDGSARSTKLGWRARHLPSISAS